MEEELISVQEAAAVLGISRRIVYREMERGRLTPAKQQQQGKRNRSFFRRGDVEQLLTTRTEEAKV